MNYTGLISMVLIPASQVAAILNSKLHKHRYFQISLKLFQMETVTKRHKNQCFMNDQLLCGNVSQYMLRPQNELHRVDFFGVNKYPTLLSF